MLAIDCTFLMSCMWLRWEDALIIMVPWKKSRLCNYWSWYFCSTTISPFSDTKKHYCITGFSSFHPAWFPTLAIQLYLLVPGTASSPARQLPGVLLLNKFLHLSIYKAESNESILDSFFPSVTLIRHAKNYNTLSNKCQNICVSQQVPLNSYKVC